jgi:hypothetical protein
MSYAKGTSVTVGKSMEAIRKILMGNKATAVGVFESAQAGAIQFYFEGIPFKYVVKYPVIAEKEVCYTKGNQRRTDAQKLKYIENEKRRLWRCLVLFIKAAIEAHNQGISDLKKTLVASMLLPSGETMYQKIENNIDKLKSDNNFLLLE